MPNKKLPPVDLSSLRIKIPGPKFTPLGRHIRSCPWCLENPLDWCRTAERLFEENYLVDKIPFGKYKNCPFSEIAHRDPSYLRWLARAANEEQIRTLAQSYLDNP